MSTPLAPRGNGALIGAVAQALALCAGFIAGQIGLPFAPAVLGQAVIELMPGWVSIPLIEALQHWAQRLLLLAALAGFMAAGVGAGAVLLDASRGPRVALLVGVAPWATAALLGALFASAQLAIGPAIAGAAGGAAAYFGLLRLLISAPIADGPGVEAAPGRRRALSGAFAVAVVAAIGALALSGPLRAVARAPELIRQTARRLRHAETVPPADPRFEGIAGLVPRITAIGDHYVVDTALVDPRVEVATWRLEIAGDVASPYSLSYDELLDLDAVEQLHTLECISNEIGGPLVGTALWTGVPLPDLLARAAPRAGARKVVLRSADGYTDSIALSKALEPQTIVAYLMNGFRLPHGHGHPARVLVPDIYGMKNVKWLTRIEVVTTDFQGYWMQRGWSDTAVVNTRSRIDSPTRVRWDGGTVAIGGIANAGGRTVARVEISTDGGTTWSDAELEDALGPLTWRRWRHLWTPPGTGSHRLLVRATDGRGATQSDGRRTPFPAGATGLHAIRVEVTR